ncbi:hypothetical protein JKF63_01844 [Porcisia hertigi]|uniref:Uncharacterized protein n=1 Tax=Porcisia hertigi TaxID=2761500 RepID=A0A836HIV8_9TRYP|nr:hypothetical protein JKF63_01844 [Porcisia hertigi]
MLKRSSPPAPLRVPSQRTRNKLVTAVEQRKNSLQSLGLVGAAIDTPSAGPSAPAFHLKRVPGGLASPKRAGARNAARHLGPGSPGYTPDKQTRGARKPWPHPPSGKVRPNSVEGPRQSARFSRPRQLSANAVVRAELSHQCPKAPEVAPMPTDEVTDEDLLLLCGVQPGTSKALWYSTMRAQLAARALAIAAEENDPRVAGRLRNEVRSSSPMSRSPVHQCDAVCAPLALPSALFELSEPPDSNTSWNARPAATARPAAQPLDESPPTTSGSDDAEEGGKNEEEGGHSNCVSGRSTRFGPEKSADASARPGGPPIASRTPFLKRLRIHPETLQKMRVTVLSLSREDSVASESR